LSTRFGFNHCPSLVVHLAFWARGFEQDFPATNGTGAGCREVECSEADGHTCTAEIKALQESMRLSFLFF